MKWRKMTGGDYESEDHLYVIRWMHRGLTEKSWTVWYRGRQLTDTPYERLRDARLHAERDRRDWEGTG